MSAVGNQRQHVLGGLLVLCSLLAVFALVEVIATVFFAITVAYVLAPLRRWIRRRGVGGTSATVLVTLAAASGAVLLLAPIATVLFYRIDEASQFLAELPETIELTAVGYTVDIVLEDVLGMAQAWLSETAIAASAALPVLAMKFGLFVFVVFALLDNERDIGEQVAVVVPPRYRDIVETLHHRARGTLFAIYVLQGATAFATVLFALPFFYLLGYDSWIAFATTAGILQFVPIVGPSILLIGLGAIEVLTGSLLKAVIVVGVGGVLVGLAPDILVRPRLATRTTELSSMLYFVGFVGGLLSLGPIGVIVGPLLIALLVEVSRMVTAGFAEQGPEETVDRTTAPDAPPGDASPSTEDEVHPAGMAER